MFPTQSKETSLSGNRVVPSFPPSPLELVKCIKGKLKSDYGGLLPSRKKNNINLAPKVRKEGSSGMGAVGGGCQSLVNKIKLSLSQFGAWVMRSARPFGCIDFDWFVSGQGRQSARWSANITTAVRAFVFRPSSAARARLRA